MQFSCLSYHENPLVLFSRSHHGSKYLRNQELNNPSSLSYLEIPAVLACQARCAESYPQCWSQSNFHPFYHPIIIKIFFSRVVNLKDVEISREILILLQFTFNANFYHHFTWKFICALLESSSCSEVVRSFFPRIPWNPMDARLSDTASFKDDSSANDKLVQIARRRTELISILKYVKGTW